MWGSSNGKKVNDQKSREIVLLAGPFSTIYFPPKLVIFCTQFSIVTRPFFVVGTKPHEAESTQGEGSFWKWFSENNIFIWGGTNY
jgi:hypothetical protein